MDNMPSPGLVPVSSSATVASQIVSAGRNQPDALHEALDQFVGQLDDMEKKRFKKAYSTITTVDLLSKIQAIDQSSQTSSRIRPYAPFVSRFLSNLNLFLVGTTSAIQVHPEVGCLIVGGIKLVLDITTRFTSFVLKLTDMINRLSGHLQHLAEYSKLCGEISIRIALVNVYGDLLDFVRQAHRTFFHRNGVEKKLNSIRVFLRVQWEPFEAGFGVIDLRIQHHLNVLLHAAQATQLAVSWNLSQATETDAAIAKKKQKALDRRNFLHWLPDAGFDEEHDLVYEKRFGQTGSWLLSKSDFQAWLNTDESRLLLCVGKPGAGKSVLASVVVEFISERASLDDSVGLAFAYFRHDSPSSQNCSVVISTWIKQLAAKLKNLPAWLLDFFHAYDRNARTPSFATHRDNLVRLLEEFEESYILLDALDELHEDERDRVTGLISHIATTLPRCKIFITRRPNPVQRYEFDLIDVKLINVEGRSIEEDIRYFVNHAVDSLIANRKLRLQNQFLKNRIIQMLIKNAEGMFLWVSLQLKCLCRHRSDSDIEDELDSLPLGLEKTFTYMLERIDQQPRALRTIAQRALLWTLFAARPLRVKELVDVVSISEEGASYANTSERYPSEVILEATTNLLVEENGLVRPCHYSVKEFLLGQHAKDSSKSVRKYFTTREEAHGALTRSCISYLLRENLIQTASPSVSQLYILLRENPLLWYAASSFDYHFLQLSHVDLFMANCLRRLLDAPNGSLTGILQIRTLGGDEWRSVENDFHPFSTTINAISFVYSTSLYEHSFLHNECKDVMRMEFPAYALHQACRGASREAVNRLLEKGYDPNSQDDDGTRPLYYAARYGCLDICEILLLWGCEIDCDGGMYGRPIQAAAFAGHLKIVQVLLREGANVNSKSGYLNTALQAAALSGHGSVVRFLVSQGAHLNINGGRYGTALQAAAYNGRASVVSYLLDQGAEIDLVGGHYGIPLQAAIWKDRNEVVKLLLDHGADVTVQGGRFGSALQAAAFRGDLENVTALVARGANMQKCDSQGRTAFHAALQGGNRKVIDYFLSNEHDSVLTDMQGRSAMHHAASGGAKYGIQKLADEGADANAPDTLEWTPLHWAAYNGDQPTINALIAAGSDPRVIDTCQRSPLHIAIYVHNDCQFLATKVNDIGVLTEKAADLNLTPSEHAISEKGSTEIEFVEGKETGVMCDGCSHEIYGTRYHCEVCYNFDFCFRCVVDANRIHPGHNFISYDR